MAQIKSEAAYRAAMKRIDELLKVVNNSISHQQTYADRCHQITSLRNGDHANQTRRDAWSQQCPCQ